MSPNTESSSASIFLPFMQALENGSITVKVPEKYWSCQGHQLSIPLGCSLWACSEPALKMTHQAVLDPVLNPGHMIKVCLLLVLFISLVNRCVYIKYVSTVVTSRCLFPRVFSGIGRVEGLHKYFKFSQIRSCLDETMCTENITTN